MSSSRKKNEKSPKKLTKETIVSRRKILREVPEQYPLEQLSSLPVGIKYIGGES
jgi:hypothetical protein